MSVIELTGAKSKQQQPYVSLYSKVKQSTKSNTVLDYIKSQTVLWHIQRGLKIGKCARVLYPEEKGKMHITQSMLDRINVEERKEFSRTIHRTVFCFTSINSLRPDDGPGNQIGNNYFVQMAHQYNELGPQTLKILSDRKVRNVSKYNIHQVNMHSPRGSSVFQSMTERIQGQTQFNTIEGKFMQQITQEDVKCSTEIIMEPQPQADHNYCSVCYGPLKESYLAHLATRFHLANIRTPLNQELYREIDFVIKQLAKKKPKKSLKEAQLELFALMSSEQVLSDGVGTSNSTSVGSYPKSPPPIAITPPPVTILQDSIDLKAFLLNAANTFQVEQPTQEEWSGDSSEREGESIQITEKRRAKKRVFYERLSSTPDSPPLPQKARRRVKAAGKIKV